MIELVEGFFVADQMAGFDLQPPRGLQSLKGEALGFQNGEEPGSRPGLDEVALWAWAR